MKDDFLDIFQFTHSAVPVIKEATAVAIYATNLRIVEILFLLIIVIFNVKHKVCCKDRNFEGNLQMNTTILCPVVFTKDAKNSTAKITSLHY